MKFTDLFIKRPVLAIVVNLVILIAGIQSIRSLSVRQYPRSDIAVIQVSTAFLAYGLATAGEFSPDPGQRLAFRVLSFLPFGLHFLFVWIPLMKAQERPVVAETPFA